MSDRSNHGRYGAQPNRPKESSAGSNFLMLCTGSHTTAHAFVPTMGSVTSLEHTNQSEREDTRVQLCQSRFDLTLITYHSRAVMTTVGARPELRD